MRTAGLPKVRVSEAITRCQYGLGISNDDHSPLPRTNTHRQTGNELSVAGIGREVAVPGHMSEGQGVDMSGSMFWGWGGGVLGHG